MGRSRSGSGPGPSGTKGSECHRSRSGERGRRDRGHGSERRLHSSRFRHSSGHQESGEGPAPGPSRLTRRMFRGLAVLRGGRRISGLLLPLIIIMEDLGRPTYPDVDVQMSPIVPQAPEKRTFTVIPSPPRPARMDDSAGVTGPTNLAKLADSAGVTGPADSADDQDSADDESAWVHDSAVGDEPEVVDDSAGVADPAPEEDSAGVADAADQQDSAVDDSARGDRPVFQGTPAGTTLAAAFTPDRQRQDTTMVSDASSLISPSLLRQINHTVLLDCLSMMTLMQRRMDMAMPVPDTQSRPVAQTPTSRDDQPLPRRSGTPVRRSRTPVRRSRTPVRHSRRMDESRDCTRFWFPIRTSFLFRIFIQGCFTSRFLGSSWQLLIKWRTSLPLMRMMMRDPSGKSQRRNINCFARLWRRLKAHLRLTSQVSQVFQGVYSGSRGRWSDTQSVIVGPAITCGHYDFYSAHSWPYSKKTRSLQFSRIRSRPQLSTATVGLPTQKLWLSASGA